MAFSNFVNDQFQHARASIAALQSIREQIEVRVAELSGVVNDNFNRLITITHFDESLGREVICQVTPAQLKNCINEDVESIDAVYSSSGDTVRIAAEEVSEKFEHQVQELQIQKEFLSSCLDNSQVDIHTWTTNMLTKYENMTASFVETFAQHFKCGDKLQALQGWCNTLMKKDVTNESVYISVTNRAEYAGDDVTVWSIVLANFTSAIDGFFDKCWQGIQDLKGFFQRLWMGIKNLAAWILRKAFRGLVSNLEAGEAKLGYLDMPLLQLQIGTITYQSGVADSAAFAIDSTIQSYWRKCYDACASGKLNLRGNNDSGYYKGSSGAENNPSLLVNSLLNKIAYFDDEINDYIFRPLDVLWAGPSWNPDLNLLFRLGCTETNLGGVKALYLQVYYACPSNIIDAMSDYEIWQQMGLSFRTFFELMGGSDKGMMPLIPTHSGTQYPDEDQNYYYWFYGSGLFYDEGPSSMEGPVNYSNYIKVLSNSDLTGWTRSGYVLQPRESLVWAIFTGILPYMVIAGPSTGLFADTGAPTSNGALALLQSGWQTTNIDRSINLSDVNAFKPYSCNYPYGVSVHFQSMQDRATELEHYIIAIIVVAAATYISVKLLRGRANLISKAAMARGQADAYTWTSGDLTPERLAEWRKLNRVARKYERLKSLFGATSKLAVSQGISQLSLTNTEKQADDYTKIKKLIVGL